MEYAIIIETDAGERYYLDAATGTLSPVVLTFTSHDDRRTDALFGAAFRATHARFVAGRMRGRTATITMRDTDGVIRRVDIAPDVILGQW